MNRITSFTIATFTVFGVVAMNMAVAQAVSYLKVDIATPDQTINSRSFNVEYTALSTEESASIDVALTQDGTVIGTDTTTKPFGDSGAFYVTVPTDGTYNYQFTATSGSASEMSEVKTVKVDTSSTDSPSYGGVSRDGNTYTVTFTAPNDSDVTEVRVYSSPNPNFTADENTQVAVASVTPGQTVTITYESPDNRPRYTAVQAFDGAGNGSTITGDPDTNVTQGIGQNAEGALPGALPVEGGPAVAGEDTDGDGQVDADGDSSTDTSNSASDLLSDGTEKVADTASDAADSVVAWVIIVALVVGTVGYANRERIAKYLEERKK